LLGCIVPLILSSLPYFILNSEATSLERARTADLEKDWINRIRSIGQRLPELTSLNWWVSDSARRMKEMFENTSKSRFADSPAGNHSSQLSASEFGTALRKSLLARP